MFRFHYRGILVEPAQDMTDVNVSSKFIDDDVLMILVPVPELGTRILWVRIKTSLCPSTVGLSGTSDSVVDIDSTLDGSWYEIVLGD